MPTTIEFVDIAGLVEGASKGEGLGNKFLAHIRETDAIAHVVRCFDDPDVVHVDGSVDPVRDIEVIHTELILAESGMGEALRSEKIEFEMASVRGPEAQAAQQSARASGMKCCMDRG